jgi:hypothetical protein
MQIIMKKILLIVSACASFFLLSCNREDAPGDNYDFGSSLPPYVTLSSTTAKTVRQGNPVTFTFQMRTAMQQAVTVYYNVTGAVTLTNQTAVIDRDKVSVVATVNIPAGVIVAPATSAVATLTLVKAVAADGTQLTIGQKNNPASQNVIINIIP